VTLAVAIIALLVLLVIVDGSEASGAHRGVPPDAEALQADGQEQPRSGSACILNVTSVFSRNRQDPRRQARKTARQGQVQTTQR
jgi:hypothetical protein